MLEQQIESIVPFGDGAFIKIPDKEIDCSNLGFFDEMEYECWDLVQKYLAFLGIEQEADESGNYEISFDVAKEIQDLILSHIQSSKVKLKF